MHVCCIFEVQSNRLQYLQWPSKVTQGHRQCHPSLDRLNFLSETGKVGENNEMILKVGQCRLRFHNSVGDISLSINGLCIVSEIFKVE